MGGVTIVIDHGLGLRSVYYCLEKSTVAVGDIVEGGAQIATGGGNKGYTDDHTCYFELWVKGTPVSYFPLISGGRNGKIVFGDIS
jgi:murein DD-endopeptidase MepM/ murein hydrolase activator NlpD